MRLGFAGTPDFAARILDDLLRHDIKPVVVYTQPDRRAGRGRRMLQSPVKELAGGAGIEVRQPASLKQERLEALALDVLVVAAYGLLLPPHILRAPRYGCINVHASLLPRWRGAAPVERAIMAGDRVSGVTIMQMDEGLDTGPTYNRVEVAIPDDMTGSELEARLAEAGAEALRDCLSDLGRRQPQPQTGEPSYAAKLTAADAEIDWRRSARDIANQVRALAERMPATCRLDTARMKILAAEPAALEAAGATARPGTIAAVSKRAISVACGDGFLNIKLLKLDRGKGNPLTPAAAMNGFADLIQEGMRRESDPA